MAQWQNSKKKQFLELLELGIPFELAAEEVGLDPLYAKEIWRSPEAIDVRVHLELKKRDIQQYLWAGKSVEEIEELTGMTEPFIIEVKLEWMMENDLVKYAIVPDDIREAALKEATENA